MTEQPTERRTRSLTWQVLLARIRLPLLLGGIGQAISSSNASS